MATASMSVGGGGGGGGGLDPSTSSHFSYFAQVLSQSRGQDTPSLLDQSEGLASLFADACQERAGLASEGETSGGYTPAPIRSGFSGSEPASRFLQSYDADEDKDDAIAWRLEEQTWRLVQLLHAERAQRAAHPTSPQEADRNPYQTPLSAVQDIIDADPALAELSIVRDWLSSNLVCNHPVEIRKGYWPFTKNRLRADKRLAGSHPPPISRTGIGQSSTAGSGRESAAPRGRGIKTLDPDATSREGSTLELEDAAYEKALNKSLFEYVRGGQLEDAMDLTRQADRSWRAASLRGANLYWRPGLADEEDDGSVRLSTPMGNRNRTLWKAVCRSLCAKASLDEYERALYGALSGDLKSVLHVSTTWDAQLWAHANARLESAVDARLDGRGGWWSQDAIQSFGLSSNTREAGAVRLLDLSVPGGVDRKSNSKTADVAAPLAVELRDVFVMLGQTEQNKIDIQANHPFRIVQRAVILSELPALLTHVESLLPSMRVTLAAQQYSRLVRFFAHLVLYLRLTKWDSMPNDVVCNSILKAYVDILEEVGEDDLVALYASSLETESAVESYAHFLKLMDANEPIEVKRNALLRAQTHDLDLAAVAVSAVAMIFDELFPSLMPTADAQKTPLAELATGVSAIEERMIRAIDWLCIHEATYGDAIRQVNTLMRLFLNGGKLNAARRLLFDVPAEVMESVGQLELQGDADHQAAELIHWRTFFDALDRHLRYVEVWSRRPRQNLRSELLNWTKGLDAVVHEARMAIMQVLQMDWIKFPFATSALMDIGTEQRSAELARIRQIYIPEMVTRLHVMLYETHEALPYTLAAAVLLPNLVADERHKLYLDFIVAGGENRLKAFLDRVRSIELASLKGNSDPFFLASKTGQTA